MANVTAINKMLIGRVEAVPIDATVGQPTLNSVWHIVEHLTTFTIHFATTKWGGKRGFLPIVLSEPRICLAARDNNLNLERLAKPEILNPKTKDKTKGFKLLHLQEDQKV